MKLLTSKNAALLLVLLAMFGSVQAKSDDDNKGSGNSDGKKGTHDFRIKKDGKRVSIIAREREGNRRGELFMQLSLNGRPRMRVSYRRKLLSNITSSNDDNGQGFSSGQDDDSTGGQQVFSYRLALLNLVETDSQSQVSQSSKKLAFLGSTKQWSEWTISRDSATNLVSIFSSFKGTGEFNAVTANLTIELSDLAQLVKGHKFDPNGLKFSLGFDNFPYSSPSNGIAFNLGLWTKSVSTIGDSVTDLNNQKFLDFQAAKFHWNDTVVADGKVVPLTLKELSRNVTSETNDEDDDSNTASESLSVLRFHVVGASAPKSVLWDPDMTVVPDEADKLIDGGNGKTSAGEHRVTLSTTTIFISLLVSIFIANLI